MHGQQNIKKILSVYFLFWR